MPLERPSWMAYYWYEFLLELVGSGGGALTARRIGFGSALNSLTGDADFVFDAASKFVGLSAPNPTAALQIGSNQNDGAQLDPAIYIDRLLDTGSDSAHAITDETEYSRVNGQYASIDVKTRVRGDKNHFVGVQVRPTLEDGTISQYVHGLNVALLGDDPGEHIALGAGLAVLSDTNYAGTSDFQVGVIVSDLSKGTENWAYYTTQNRSRFRGITSAFGTIPTDMPFSFFGDEDTGIGRGGANILALVAGGVRSLDVTATGTIQKGIIQGIDASDVEYFLLSPTSDSYLRDDRPANVTRFNVVNASTAVGSVAAEIGVRNAAGDAPNSEAGLIVAGENAPTVDWLFEDGWALRGGSDLSGGGSIVALAGGLRFYTANLALSIDHTTQHATFANGLTVASYLAGVEEAEPAAPAANGFRIFAKDTGGKTELMVRFASGASQQLAIEP